MSPARELSSGKGHRDENFPVASFLIEARHRPVVMAFYRFARTADDVADHPLASEAEKLALLEGLRATLAGESDREPTALALRRALGERDLSPEHGLDLLEAFRRDVAKRRYATWDELMDYCRYSAAPVGRQVLEIHGEARATWAASDALCAALQVINHLQDCADDRRDLDRVYIPEAELAAAGTSIAALDAGQASPALKSVISSLATRTLGLLADARPLAAQVRDPRLRMEVVFIHRLAEDLAQRLTTRDPLSERVHHRKPELLALAGASFLRFLTEPRARAARTVAAEPVA
jgi:squalene synthase HpnC